MENLEAVNNVWQAITVIITAGFGVLALWIKRHFDEDEKKIETRKQSRDTQISLMQHQLTKHLEEHNSRDTRFWTVIDKLEEDIHEIDIKLTKLCTIFDERNNN